MLPPRTLRISLEDTCITDASSMASEVIGPGNIEVPPWLKSLPVAPEYHPTLLEFQDPISYIFKIEKEASKYGICKIVPPVSASSRKTVISNFTKSLLARSNDLGPTFTTRKQQVGFCPRKHRPVQKSVWQSGERYALVEFELKAKNFEKNYLKKCAKKGLTPLDIEALYWNAMADKPFEVEYANDMPGSAFMVHKSSGKRNDGTVVVGETDWNMRRVSRDNLSLLKFMREEIPGVTSPMVYVAMMFSWFAWHVEDHDFHSMNYLHMGSSKTWYGVPREAAVAFEEVIREHGYGGDINPLVTFATLGEKTTVMSPEVLLNAGVPCCRLVQNAGEFVVTFPRAYHSGFSHGFNCGEAANIATPEWLRVAKDAAIRRAAINCSPMVSHFQLLYDLVLSFCSSIPKGVSPEPRSTRLKDRKKTEGEKLVKELFLEDMLQNNEMLHVLGKGSSVVLLPQNFLSHAVSDSTPFELQSTAKSGIFPNLSNPDHKLETTSSNPRDRVQQSSKLGFHVVDRITISSLYSSSNIASQTHTEQTNAAIKRSCRRDQGLFSCVSCGILCYACVAIVRPTDEAACYIASADCSVFNCWDLNDNDSDQIRDAKTCGPNLSSEFMLRNMPNGFHSMLASGDLPRYAEQDTDMVSNIEVRKEPSSLGLLALEYGNSSDSEEDEETATLQFEGCVEGGIDTPEKVFPCNSIDPKASSITDCFLQITDSDAKSDIPKCKNIESRDLDESNSMMDRHKKPSRHDIPDASAQKSEAIPRIVSASSVDTALLFSSRSDEDSSRLHVFCLQHALQVQKQLSRVGGAHVFLACHPEYPKLESHAKKVAEELGNNGLWSEVSFHQSTGEDEEIIRLALASENAVHGNRDWAVKLGINLFYSANLSRSPLYSKQMHYNSVIYVAFGRTPPTLDSPETKSEPEERGFGRQRKVVVAGKWCGKLWMSSQAHPFLVDRDAGEQEDEASVAPVVKPDLKYARRSRRNQDSGNVSLIGTGNKNRKNAPKNLLHVEEKSAMPGNMDDKDDEEEDSCLLLSLCGSSQNFKRKRGSRKVKEENVNSETLDEPSEGTEVSETCKQHGNRRKKETCEDEDSSEEFPLSNTWKRIKAQLGALRTEKEHPQPTRKDGSKTEFDPLSEAEEEGGPSTRLRTRTKKPCNDDRGSRTANARMTFEKPCKEITIKKSRALKTSRGSSKSKVSDDEEADYPCDMDGCSMSFGSKHELGLHKRNICPVKGCGKKFFSHKYLVQHRRVHVDDRPLKCPWRGCKMTFKWAWARTEHIRVHTGDRPYVCTETGCGQTFRFVSDFSRHKRKTGHTPKKIRG